MEDELFFSSTYKGSKQFKQQDVPMANATGFGAAADDYMERGIDLNEQLIRNKPATFFFKMNSNAMNGAGIQSGDILIVDRSVKAISGKIIIAAIDGELVVRRLSQTMNRIILQAENRQFRDIVVEEFTAYQPWGVVTCVIHILEKGLL
ncbi:LexA family protein [Ferruginibacter albus]|uniref:LexA family protein n=1 Tax=Ferruginibacter albus TaxID=2875540 RepID=UPI001CC8221A|nr:translesion error-prone DNA polymerase V autoproteolytic subunit [Ferruginibacter albus]UAY52298.1 translesion error-prone DNA polymerase V autoproteolytic subunit [Ferruginibacter albus]